MKACVTMMCSGLAAGMLIGVLHSILRYLPRNTRDIRRRIADGMVAKGEYAL